MAKQATDDRFSLSKAQRVFAAVSKYLDETESGKTFSDLREERLIS